MFLRLGQPEGLRSELFPGETPSTSSGRCAPTPNKCGHHFNSSTHECFEIEAKAKTP